MNKIVNPIEDLQKDVNTLSERASDMIVFDRLSELKQGIKETKAKYSDTYTEDALQDTVNEYIHNKKSEIKEELNNFDNKSREQLEKIEKEISKQEARLKTKVDPQTSEELALFNYVMNKLQNELSDTFTGSQASMRDIESVLNQAKHNKHYANALIQNRNMLMNNISNNQNIDNVVKNGLRTNLDMTIEDLKSELLPKEYHKLEELKEKVINNRTGSKGKTSMFNMMLDNSKL